MDKKRTNLWVIVGVIVVLAIAAFLIFRDRIPQTYAPTDYDYYNQNQENIPQNPSEDSLDSIDNQFENIDLGDFETEFQSIDFDINTL